jgi:hypothetical protein
VPVRAYRTQAFSNTHENEAFDELLAALQGEWGGADELLLFIGNFLCNGAEIDAMVLRRDCIVVIDFKNYGGAIEATENGPWVADGVAVKGGAKRNPLIQIRENKFKLLDFIRRQLPDVGKEQNLGQIAGLALFSKPVEFDDDQLPPKVRSWFKVADREHALQRIAQIASPGINLNDGAIEAIVRALGVQEYRLPGAPTPVGPGISLPGEAVLPQSLRDPLACVLAALDDDSTEALIVTGMVGTGADDLLVAARDALHERGRDVTVLQLSRRYADRGPFQAESIFTVVYESRGKMQGEHIHHAIRKNDHTGDHVYLLANGQFVSDDKFERDLRQYGSGRVLTDLLEFVDVKKTARRLVVFGDPFQLCRGEPEATALSCDRLSALAGGHVEELRLEYLVDGAGDGCVARNAQTIAGCLASGAFYALAIEDDGTECALALTDDASREESMREQFRSDPRGTKFVAYSNDAVDWANQWVRREVFGRDGPLQPGDIIHFRNGLSALTHPGGVDRVFVANDSFAEVSKVFPEVERIEQPLQGRPEPVRISFGRARVKLLDPRGMLTSKEVEFRYIVDYVNAARPEFEVDWLVALRVHTETRFRQQKAELREKLEFASTDDEKARLQQEHDELLAKYLTDDPLLNAARIRLGYALTLHRAQNCSCATAIVDMDTGQGRANEAYFRWAYTVFTVDADRRVLIDPPCLSPLSEARWDASQARLDTKRPGAKIAYPKSENSFDGLEGDRDPCLVALEAHVRGRLAQIGARLVDITSHQWLERYTIGGESDEECVLDLHYNGKFDVTNLGVGRSRPDGFGKVVAAALERGDLDFSDAYQELLCGVVGGVLAPAGLAVVAIEHHNYQEVYVVESDQGWGQLRLFYEKSGRVSRIALAKYSDEVVKSSLAACFGGG